MSLDDCFRYAVGSSEDVRIRQRLFDNAHRDRLNAISGLLPTIDYSLSRAFTQYDPALVDLNGQQGIILPGTQNTLVSTLTFTEVLYDNHVTIDSIKRTGYLETRAAHDRDETLGTLLLDVATLYYSLGSSWRIDQLLAEEESVSREVVELARRSYDVGRAPRTDVLKAQVELQARIARHIRARNDFAAAKAGLLARLTMEAAPAAIEPAKPADPAPFAFRPEPDKLSESDLRCRPLAEELASARETRPELLSAALDVNVAEVNLYDSWRKFAPQLAIQGSYAWSNPAAFADGSQYYHQASAAATVSWRVWDWGTNFRNISSERALRDNLEDTQAQLRRAVGLELQTACLALDSRRSEYLANVLRVSLARENLEKSQETYRLGKDTIEGVFRARDDYFQAQQDKVTSYYALRTAEEQRERANGSIGLRVK